MEFVPSETQISKNPVSKFLLAELRELKTAFDWDKSILYYLFPLYRDSDGNNIQADAILLSPSLGVIAFGLPNSQQDIQNTLKHFDQVPAHIHSRLIRTKSLRRGLNTLIPEIRAGIYLPDGTPDLESEIKILNSRSILRDFLTVAHNPPLPDSVYQDLLATLDGAKGIIRPTPRIVLPQHIGKKAETAYLVETAINDFDIHQKHGMFGSLEGPTRIRGIAGSGKTVVLAMKVAQIHLRDPEAKILYCFATKSLYQHVKRLITRFYRQFVDTDPNWENVRVMHAWGGQSEPGAYSVTAESVGVKPLTWSAASALASKEGEEAFDYACKTLEQHHPRALFDYVLVDEAQDFPSSFLRICYQIAREGRFVFAYDELQNIFQPNAPTVAEIFGSDGNTVELHEDVILQKSYRNPREILVVAHAIGFGFYSERIVQILEDKAHWESLGYSVISGDFSKGSRIVLERPEETSLNVVSRRDGIREIIAVKMFDDMKAEIEYVVSSVQQDLADGLRPEDILVICVDDRNARSYLTAIQISLGKLGVSVNNVHASTGLVKEFFLQNHVTMSTVHKAKGNEAFMVYVCGTDSPMSVPTLRKRNMLFTAMSRSKAWLRISGMGPNCTRLVFEMEEAIKRFPRLEFTQPGGDEIALIKRDIKEVFDKRARLNRILSDIEEFSGDFGDDLMEVLQKKLSRNSSPKLFRDDGET